MTKSVLPSLFQSSTLGALPSWLGLVIPRSHAYERMATRSIATITGNAVE
jgi:hypothetical protein